MGIEEVLILVKTYPEYSVKYTETVCTAGILKQSRRLVRLYPVRYRYLEGESQFSKYQWINVRLQKATSDSRLESYNIFEDSIKMGTIIESGKDWNERTKWVLNGHNVYHSVEELYDAQESSGISLGLIRLKALNKFNIEPKQEADIAQALKKKETIMLN